MQVQTTPIPDVLVFTPTIYSDNRGSFFESFNHKTFNQLLLKYHNCYQNINFVQDNHSISKKNVLRGLHYQIQNPQGKLVRVIKGKALDIAVDIRKSSPTFGQYVSQILSANNQKQLWIPAGFAHGFLALEDCEFLYKTTEYRYPEYERTIIWNDCKININWEINNKEVILSDKDKAGVNLEHAQIYE